MEKLKLSKRVEIIAAKYKLSEKAKAEISKLLRDSYIEGSNDCYNIYFKR